MSCSRKPRCARCSLRWSLFSITCCWEQFKLACEVSLSAYCGEFFPNGPWLASCPSSNWCSIVLRIWAWGQHSRSIILLWQRKTNMMGCTTLSLQSLTNSKMAGLCQRVDSSANELPSYLHMERRFLGYIYGEIHSLFN